MHQPFKIYRSSAGSGKTYTLAKEYLKLVLKASGNKAFMQILAVTFTNKATAEMKERIIGYLQAFSAGNKNEMYEELRLLVNLKDDDFQKRCQLVLSNILHQYAHFSISTIDAFFQKVIRAFAKEVGLFGGFTLEMDQQTVLTNVVNDLMDEIGENKSLTQWLLNFSEDKVDGGKSWDISSDIRSLGGEVFKEAFKQVAPTMEVFANNPAKLSTLVKEFQKIVNQFKHHLAQIGTQGLKAIDDAGLAITDFSYGRSGVANYFHRLVMGNDLDPKKRARDATDNIEGWYSKSSDKKDRIEQLVETVLIGLLNDAVAYHDNYVENYESARQVLKNLYTFGILSDITRKLTDYKKAHDIMLISDAAYFLQEIINDNDSPFIYEKVGSFYRHFLIDEFQDTSVFQWQNFKPLIENSLAEGFQNMIVGDVKQSIYRWRGGDWRLLLEGVEQTIHPAYIEGLRLTENFRSFSGVIDFNNVIFEKSSIVLSDILKGKFSSIDDQVLKDTLTMEALKIRTAYQDVAQTVGRGGDDTNNGLVNLTFFDDQDEDLDWKSQVLDTIPLMMERLQDKGIALRDVVVLVRNGKEGREVANALLTYQKSTLCKPGYNYDVVSNEALFLNAAPAVQFLVNVLKYLANPKDQVAKVSVIYEYQRYILNNDNIHTAQLMHEIDEEALKQWLPENFVKQRNYLGKMPLYEKVEVLIAIFGLKHLKGEWVYILSFQDVVLNFTSTEKGDVNSFLTWWEEHEGKLTIQRSEEVDAMRIMTIHKSKGLQFKVVILPFLSWELDVDSRKNNIIWAKPQKFPYQSLGYFPLRYSSDLAKTVFKEDYYREKIMANLDNLNLLYVAFTRAEEGLIVYGQKPKPSKNNPIGGIKNVGNLVYELTKNESYFDAANWKENSFLIGSIDQLSPSTVKKSEFKSVFLTDYVSNSWRSKLAIKPKAKDFFHTDAEKKQAKINYGLLVHDLLARIKHKDQLLSALEELVQEGIVNHSEKTALRDKMARLFKQEKINAWFTAENDWEVKTEVPILPKTGEVSRLDRVLTNGSKAIVIDFKTGLRKNKDQEQVLEYADLMKSMGFTDINAYLLYIEDEVVEKVK